MLAYIGSKDTREQKGNLRWIRGIWLGKTNTNDQHIVGIGSTNRLTRSIKSIDSDWSVHRDMYDQFRVQPYMIEGAMGNKLMPNISYRRDGHRVDDEAASDPESEDETTQTMGFNLGFHSVDGTRIAQFEPSISSL